MKKFSNGIDQKNIIEKFGPSRLYAFLKVGLLILLSIVTVVLAYTVFPPLIFGGILFAFLAWYRYMTILQIQYTLTLETLTVRTGLISRTYNNLELYRVKDYIVSQSATERIFNLMTVKLVTTDASSPELILEGIELSNITETIRELVQKARMKNNVYEIN